MGGRPGPDHSPRAGRRRYPGFRSGRADDTDTADFEAKLDDLLNKIFDMKMDNQKTQVDKMSTELSKLRERIKERSGAREDVIRSRKRELLGQRDAYDW